MQKFSQVNLSDRYMVNMDIKLGKGSTGCVYEGKDLRNHDKVAVKIIELGTIDNEVTRYLLEMEKKAIMAITNPYVLKGLKIWQDTKFCFMVTQYCNGGTLKNHIHKKGKLSEEASLKLVERLLEGYQHLVRKGIVHRDLKPANIMLHDQIPKIIDFGYCEIEGHKKPSLQYNVGSPSYMAPESFQLNLYNEKTEIWAFGVILFECATGRTIDEGRKMTQAYKEIEETGVPYPHHISQKIRKVIDWCLSLSPRKRPTCQQLLHYLKSLHKPQNTTIFSQTSSNKENILKQKKGKIEKTKNNCYLIKSTRVSTTNSMNNDQLKYSKYIPRNNFQNKVRPCFSNYAKIQTTQQQPEHKAEFSQRVLGKQNQFMSDYGLKKYPTYAIRQNNYYPGGRQTTRTVLYPLANNATPPIYDNRREKRFQSAYTQNYRH